MDIRLFPYGLLPRRSRQSCPIDWGRTAAKERQTLIEWKAASRLYETECVRLAVYPDI